MTAVVQFPAAATNPYFSIDGLASVRVAAKLSLLVGHTKMLSVILIEGFVISIFIGFADTATFLFPAVSSA